MQKLEPKGAAGEARSSEGDRRLGKYRLLAKLATGGQADVFLALARGPLGVDKLAVVKQAPRTMIDDPDRLTMFIDEARLAAKLSHPNVVNTYEVGEDGGAPFIAMEYLEGQPLHRVARSPEIGRLTLPMRLRIVADALRGLHYAHCLRDFDGKPLGIVHRDISPHNIFVTYEGVTKIVDFGIAKATSSASETKTGLVKGKTAYMSPEQAGGSSDARSDVFSMGVVLWELLSGKRLFEGDALAVLQKLVYAPIPRLRAAAPAIDPVLDELVAKALARDPDDRFPTADAMRVAIEEYLALIKESPRDVDVGATLTGMFRDARAEVARKIAEATSRPDVVAKDDLPAMDVGGPNHRSDSGPVAANSAPPALDSDVTARVPRERALVTAKPALPSRARLPVIAGAIVAGVVAWIAVVIPKTSEGSSPAATAPSDPAKAAGAAKTAACKTPIAVRIAYDMTGPTKEVGAPAGKGEYDYLRAINEAGGIRGCRVDIDVQDTKYDKAATLDAYAAWRSAPAWADVSTIFVQGTPMTEALGPLATKDEKVLVSGSFAGDLAAPSAASADVDVPSLNGGFAEAALRVHKATPGYPYVFFQGTDYTTAARVAASYAWKQGAKRMGFFYCTTSTFCTDPVDGAKTFLKTLGGTKIGRDLALELTDDEATVERKVMRYFREERARKVARTDYVPVDWIWLGNTRVNAAHLGKALKKARAWMGFDVHVVADNWAVDEALPGLCGDACAGFDVVQPFAMFGDPSASGMAALLADHQRFRRADAEPADAYRVEQYVYGRVAVAAWRIAVERLIDEGKPVTGANLRTALEGFHNVDVEGFATLGYTPNDHRPQSGARIATLGAKGKLEPVGQPLSLTLEPTWLGW